MYIKIAFLLTISLLAVPFENTAASVSNLDDPYTVGISHKENGRWEAALNTWRAARDSVAEKGQADARIGLAFIELATEKKATQYYEQASEMYFWGFSADNLRSEKAIILEEIQRMAPLLPEEVSNTWEKWLDKADPALGAAIKEFWIRKDPIPTTAVNERLIEHWERLAHVKEKFTLENTTVYGTDDRGLVFMKFGEPDEKFAGKLGTDQMEIMRWFDDFALRQEIQRFNSTPECEIWRYVGLRPRQTTVFLFGKKAGFGKYGQRYGVEDFLPDRAFRRGSMQTTRGVLPGAMLQLMFYRDLIDVDQFYLDRFRELETMWANARAGGRLGPDYDVMRAKVADYRNRDVNTIRFKFLPEGRTDALEGLDPMDLKYKLFRYLDDDRNSRLAIMVVSSDKDDSGLDFVPYFRAGRKTKYKPRHIVVSYDSDWNLEDRVVDYPALQNTNTSTFSLIQSAALAYALVSEKVLLDARTVQLQEPDIPDTAKVMGVGSAFLGTISPLSVDSTQFEVSDVLLGTEVDQAVDSYPFPVIPKDPVGSNELLVAYLEFYNLVPKDASSPKIRIDYEILQLEHKNEEVKKKLIQSKTVRFVATEHRLSKMYPIELDNLEAGDYELSFRITNEQAKIKRDRTTPFRIIE